MNTTNQNLKNLLDSILPEQGKILSDWDCALTCGLVSQQLFDSKILALRQIATEYFIPPVVNEPKRTALTRAFVDQTIASLNMPEISFITDGDNLSFSRSEMLRFTVTIGKTSKEEFISLLDSIK